MQDIENAIARIKLILLELDTPSDALTVLTAIVYQLYKAELEQHTELLKFSVQFQQSIMDLDRYVKGGHHA